MNDLTFGATLLSCLALLAVAVIVESTSVPALPSATIAAAVVEAPPVRAPLQLAAADCDCRPTGTAGASVR